MVKEPLLPSPRQFAITFNRNEADTTLPHLLPCYPKNLISTELIIETIKLKAKAHPKFLILKPSTNLSTSITSNVFITRTNSPKVIAINGILKRTRIGFTRIFAIERPAATQMALQKFFISTPLKTFAVIKTETLFINQAQNIYFKFLLTDAGPYVGFHKLFTFS